MIPPNTGQPPSQDRYVKFTISWEDGDTLRNNITVHGLSESDVPCLLNIGCNLYDVFVHPTKKAVFNEKYGHLEMNPFDRDGDLVRVISRYSTELENFTSPLSISLLKTQRLAYMELEKAMMTLLFFHTSDSLHGL